MEEAMTEESSPEVQPDRRKHGYQELEKKLDDHAKAIEDRLSAFISKAMVAFAIIGLFSTGSLIGFGILLKQQGHTADEIQQQRREAIIRNCVDQNKRHDNTIEKFQQVALAAEKKDPKQRTEIQAAVKANLTIIEALVPKQDCAELVLRSVEVT